LLLTLFLASCSGPASGQGMSGYVLNLDVAPRFREFYLQLGGAERLGIPISPLFAREGREYQYTAAVLMVYDPLASEDQRFSLAPIGRQLGVAEPYLYPELPGGHEVYPGFRPLYDAMGGAAVLGLPLTEVRYNPERGGIEQFFENVGFYQLETDPPETVKLIHYGAWLCNVNICGYVSPDEAVAVLPEVVWQPFDGAIKRLNPQLVGRPISERRINDDGLIEQIFENVVVVASQDSPGNIRFLPLPGKLGLPVQSWSDFEIAPFFEEFLRRSGGLELAGKAVSDLEPQSPEVFRQCFVTLCLDYLPGMPGENKVRAVPLGRMYRDRLGAFPTPTPAAEGMVTLQVFKNYPVVAPTRQQILNVRAYLDSQPLQDVRPELTLMLPGGVIEYRDFPPTDVSGRTSLQLEPIAAPHGTRIDYEVCLTVEQGGQVCLEDYFLIWESQD